MTEGREKVLRVMIAGGGTGGHVYPGISIYRALEARCGKIDVLFIGVRGGVESGILDRLGLPYLLLPGRGVRGASLRAKLVAPFILKWAVLRAMRAIISFKPDVVLGTGGYASVSAILAAMLCGKLRVLQEQNSIPGLANRLLSRIANLVLLSYEESRAYVKKDVPSLVIGNPLRFEPHGQPFSKAEALASFGLEEGLPTIVIFGGSRGAQSINQAGIRLAQTMSRERSAQFILLSGERNFAWVQREVESCASLVKVLPFLEEMERAYVAADLAVARAGASSVFELAAFGIPSIFVPYPYAADDHQRHNVARLHELAAVEVVEDSQLGGDVLVGMVKRLIEDNQRLHDMSESMRSWVKTDAAQQAAAAISALVKKKKSQ
ncbi:MAG: undecaprenyldiphospho-muramoylpentapeptide beta-N-acetylglucosaminyltransferase [Candidatus Latescibacterota bacterium]